MSLSFTLLRPSDIVICRGSKLACIGARLTDHFPSGATVALALCPANLTVTFLPGTPSPQIATLLPCWRTMLSPMTFGRLICACAAVPQMARAAMSEIVLLSVILMVLWLFRAKCKDMAKCGDIENK